MFFRKLNVIIIQVKMNFKYIFKKRDISKQFHKLFNMIVT